MAQNILVHASGFRTQISMNVDMDVGIGIDINIDTECFGTYLHVELLDGRVCQS